MGMERELIFDIDLSDYDDVRNCCSEKKICNNCWPLMICAVKVLNTLLREDFGFKSILFVFSGRRGIHCWVCDKDARILDVSSRIALINYLTIKKFPNLKLKSGIHFMIEQAYQICEPIFINCILLKQNLFKLSEERNKLIKMIWDFDLREKINISLNKFINIESNKDKFIKLNSYKIWNIVKKEFDLFSKHGRKYPKKLTRLKFNQYYIILNYTYPRFDAEVTKHQNHLLKSPFCFHPITEKLCIPLDVSSIEEFIPNRVPTLSMLYKELKTVLIKKTNKNKIYWKYIPVMKKYIEVFEKYLLNIYN